MRTEIREITIPERVIPEYKTTKQVFVSFDGCEFEDAGVCQAHERELFRQTLDKSGNIIICHGLFDLTPFDGGEYNNNYYDYIWFKLLNESGRDELIKAYPDILDGSKIPIGKWCVLESETGGDAYWSRVIDGFVYIERILKALSDLEPDIFDKVRKGEDI